ncbi:gliding motility-associated C-terminal domain-containing protein [Winogradskyella sp. 3972H.M.0a.05]|uniref:gliding motility-associated C-terminal domain-containing protein n=1 Tax=Winogradskyella sp. 3972H.M.0a.05 TaxID=2950277 RepID=UPI003399A41E
MKPILVIFFLFLLGFPQLSIAQDVSLYQQFNGRYDYTAIGNTLNLVENGPLNTCDIITSSSADLSLDADQTIIAAYLYWAGSGNGDLDVELNGQPISAERVFNDALDPTRVFFAAFADVTTLIENQSSTTYTLSEFDISTTIPPYCPTGTNFAGWAITVIYEDSDLPLNQVNVYDGLQSVPTNLMITLDNLNVLDNEGAKIGFVAWEGDAALAVNEQLTINGNVIGNPPLNPLNNAFNGTNSFTGATDLYNMDIDVYDIQDNINIGDTTATINLTSGQDFVMINNVITVLNSQLPDATIVADNFGVSCGLRTVELEYTVSNTNSTDPLPSGTPIAFYADGILVGQSNTINVIPINGSEANNITLLIPESIDYNFELVLVVDDDGTGLGIVTEIVEDNNTFSINIELLQTPELITLSGELLCDEGFDSAIFNLVELAQNQIESITGDISFYETLEGLEAGENQINDPEAYNNITNPQTVYIRVEDIPCYRSYALELEVENCPPVVPQGFSPNTDNKNDWFNIQGLYNIFEDHQLLIYNRHGVLIFEGNNDKKWDGITNRGINNRGKLVPVGTYFYILYLNDPNYDALNGWVYVNY